LLWIEFQATNALGLFIVGIILFLAQLKFSGDTMLTHLIGFHRCFLILLEKK